MSHVWKRLQRVGKKAAKFHFKTNSHELLITCSHKWQPNKVSFTLAHRNRKITSKSAQWEPGEQNVYEGKCKWPSKETMDFDATLYKGINDEKFEVKEWSVIVEYEDHKNRKHLLANCKLNLEPYAKIEQSEQVVCLNLKLLTNKVQSVVFKFKLLNQLIKQGKATDEDMISIHSYDSSVSTFTNKFNGAIAEDGFPNDADEDADNDDGDNANTDEKLFSIKNDSNNNININSRSIISSSNNNTNGGKTKEEKENNEILSETSSNLLEWCKSIVGSNGNNRKELNNFSTSWKSGVAFCQIIQHFRPNLVNLNEINENDPRHNLKLAFSATDSENIPRVIELSDILHKDNPDKLAIMTYLYQIRAHYEQPPKQQPKKVKPHAPPPPTTPQLKIISASTPIKNSQKSPKLKKPLYETHDQYTNPFGSDSEDEEHDTSDQANSKQHISSIVQIKSNGQIIDATSDELFNEEDSEDFDSNNPFASSHASPANRRRSKNSSLTNSPNLPTNSDVYKQQARKLIQQTKANTSSSSSSFTFNEPQQPQYKQENLILARRLISEAKKNNKKILKKPKALSDDSTLNSSMSESLNDSKKSPNSSTTSPTKNKDETHTESSLIGEEYVNDEILLAEKEQEELDTKAILLEKDLRDLMSSNGNDENAKAREDECLRQWFLLVNQKSALIHRQLELEILQKEKNLLKRYELLSKELRKLMQFEDKYKTEEMKRNEKRLLGELISLVDTRNELVELLDEENRNLESEQEINNFIQNCENLQNKPDKVNCVVQ